MGGSVTILKQVAFPMPVTLAELVVKLEDNTLSFAGTASDDEARKMLEWFGQRNFLVARVLEGQTTFSREFGKAAGSFASGRFWPSLGRTEEAKTLDYLLKVPVARDAANCQAHTIIPEDYYTKELLYSLADNSKIGKPVSALASALQHLWKDLAMPFGSYIVAGWAASLISEKAAVPVGLSVAGLVFFNTAYRDHLRRKRNVDNLRHTAELLDSVVQSTHPSIANEEHGLLETAKVRHRLARQYSATARVHLNQKRYVEAAEAAAKAVQLAPLLCYHRRILVLAYAYANQVPGAFAELREARVLFGAKVNALDANVSAAYYNWLKNSGHVAEASAVFRSMGIRAGHNETENAFRGSRGRYNERKVSPLAK